MKAQRPLLSVVLTSRNQLNALKFTLLSLRDQVPQVPYEILVVDCESKDGTVQFLADQAAKDTIRIVEARSRVGRGAARNQGAMAAHGRYLMFLDAGIVLGPSWWESLVRTLDRDVQVAACAGRILVPDGRIDHAGQALLAWEEPDQRKLAGRSVHAGRLAEALGPLKPLLVGSLAGEALLVRASAFFGVGGFSEDIGVDHVSYKTLGDAEPAGLDLCLKLGQRRWRCVFQPESVMTRLRVAERADLAEAELAGCAPAELHRLRTRRDQDQGRITERWLGEVVPDFRVTDAGVTPTEIGSLRSYSEPILDFTAPGRRGLVHPYDVNQDAEGPIVSVVVLTRDDLHQSRRGLEALVGHLDPRHELVFVDHGSSDGTVAFLQDLTAQHANSRLLLNESNPGVAAGLNQGIAEAAGDYIVLLRSGTVVTDGWLDRLIAAAETHPRAGLVSAAADTALPLAEGSAYDVTTLEGLAEYAATCATDRRGEVERTLRPGGFCLLIKRELVARIGGFDEAFARGHFENNDYGLRAHLAGYDALVARDCYVHRAGGRNAVDLDIEDLDRIQSQWEIFKDKWGIDQDTALNAPLDLAELLAVEFDPARHCCGLPGFAITEPEIEPAVTAEG